MLHHCPHDHGKVMVENTHIHTVDRLLLCCLREALHDEERRRRDFGVDTAVFVVRYFPARSIGKRDF